MTKSRLLRSFVNGRALEACPSVPTYELRDAATGAPSRSGFRPSTSSMVDAAVSSAADARGGWASTAPSARSGILRAAAELIRSRAEELARDETRDTGRTLAETRGDAADAAACLHFYAGLAPVAGGSVRDIPGGSWAYTRREPLGTGACIGAWNYPLLGAVWKSAPALATGNAVVFKPSEETPLGALALAEAFLEAGVPPGVFNVILGGAETGRLLVEHPGVDKVSFTGSLETGRQVYASAAQGLKRATMELGGKSPLIIFGDANVDQAVSAAMAANWCANGQACSNGTRVFVHDSIKEEFLERLLWRTAQLKIGHPLADDTDIGPMVTAGHRERVRSYINAGVAEGASLLLGSSEPPALDDPSLSGGYFLSPVVFADCTDDMTIVREEIFGMVMSVLTFAKEDEVIARANATEYGLAAGVFTHDLRKAHRVAAALQAGTVWINNYNLAPVEIPWGGYKMSGVGRENGSEAIESWTQVKSVYVEMNDIESPYQ